MNDKEYFNLRIKRASKLYPSILAVTVLFLLIIAVVCILIISANSKSSERQKLTIGIVGDMTDTYLDVGLAAVQNLDTSRHSLDFVEMTEAEAVSRLKNGSIAGFLNIPDGFVESVMNMENKPISIVTANDPESIGDVLIDEIAESVSSLIEESQKGIFGMQKLSNSYGKVEYYWDNTEKLNIRYTELILHRDSIYEPEYLGLSEGLSMGGYYVCGALTVLLMLWGISCSSLLIKKDRSMEKLMLSRGRGVISQIVSEFAVFFIFSFITFAGFVLIAGAVLQFIEIGITEIDGQYFSYYIGLALKLIPVIVMMNSLQFLLYESMDSVVGVMLTQFVYALGTGYICGCFYPSHFFPEGLQKFSEKIPTGVGFEYLRSCLSLDIENGVVLGVLLYASVFFAVSVAVRKYKLVGKKQ